MDTIFDWINPEDFPDEEILIQLEGYMAQVLSLDPDTETPTYHPHTKEVSFDNGYSFVIPLKYRSRIR